MYDDLYKKYPELFNAFVERMHMLLDNNHKIILDYVNLKNITDEKKFVAMANFVDSLDSYKQYEIIKNNKDILDKINKIMLDVDSKRIESKKVGLKLVESEKSWFDFFKI